MTGRDGAGRDGTDSVSFSVLAECESRRSHIHKDMSKEVHVGLETFYYMYLPVDLSLLYFTDDYGVSTYMFLLWLHAQF